VEGFIVAFVGALMSVTAASVSVSSDIKMSLVTACAGWYHVV